jgi:hypothetical protein
MAAEQAPVAQGRLWFIRRGRVVKGPFPAAAIKRHLLLGRLTLADEVSHDTQSWVALGVEPTFVADAGAAITGAASAGSLDERSGHDRRSGRSAETTPQNRRAGPDRRRPEPPELVERRQRRIRVAATLTPPRATRSAAPMLVLCALTIGVLVAFLRFEPQVSGTADCRAPARPNVNWDGCVFDALDLSSAALTGATLRNARLANVSLFRADLSRADLSYVELNAVRMGYANLAGARLRGATLRQTELDYADLHGADLSYADLRGASIGGAALADARLDNALWIDGRTCAAGSLGDCR